MSNEVFTLVNEKLILDLVNKGLLIKVGGRYEVNHYLDFPKSLGFEDVAITQNKNVVSSRLDVDISSEVCRGVTLKVPIVAANMSTVTGAWMAHCLNAVGGMGILHRAWPDPQKYYETVDLLAKVSKIKWVAASVGVGDDQVELAKRLIHRGASIIVIDIAHGYSEAVKEVAKKIKDWAPEVKIIVGNTVNPDMLSEFDDVADAVKVGIAQGAACETKNTAGCTEKQFSAVLKFKEESKRLGMPIISDGGIREPADFVKAIAAGASSVMAGSIFARCPESAAEVVDGKKIYAGMASRYVQEKWKGGVKEGTCPEGKVITLDIGEPVAKLVERYAGALRSGITYAGAKSIKDFQEKVQFVRI